MAKIIGLPKLSPTMEEGTLAKWVVKEGDEVDVDDLLAEVETDKATMEFRSFDRGVLLKILAEEGDTLAPDTPVAIIGEKGEDIADLVEQAQGAGPAEAKAEPEAEPKAEEPDAEAKSEKAKAEEPEAPKRKERRSGDRIFASPLVRRLAREEDIDLADVEGTGPHGRIIKRDLDAFIEGGGAKKRAAAPGGPATTWDRPAPVVERASQMRKAIARRLTESKQTVPHFYLTIDVNAAGLIETRAEMNASLTDEKVSFNDLVIKASAVALRRFPDANASWIDGEIHRHQVVDISVAVAVADGLVTPVVRDADRKGVLTIAREVRELAARARDKKLTPEEMQNGTFSISNLGMYGVEEFAAVINPPEGALLAVGALRDAPVVKDGQLVAGKMMKLTLSCDHRVVDGAVGAQYLQVLQGLLERPATMLL